MLLVIVDALDFEIPKDFLDGTVTLLKQYIIDNLLFVKG